MEITDNPYKECIEFNSFWMGSVAGPVLYRLIDQESNILLGGATTILSYVFVKIIFRCGEEISRFCSKESSESAELAKFPIKIMSPAVGIWLKNGAMFCLGSPLVYLFMKAVSKPQSYISILCMDVIAYAPSLILARYAHNHSTSQETSLRTSARSKDSYSSV